MLDEARHFFGKEVVKNIFDVMASLKFNTFHWHLTDDQGWRIEIKKYPRLIEVGSKRKGTKLAKSKIFINSSVDSKETDGIPVVGFYSQEDIKEIIDYAAERYIRIIPEIDLPGHTMALLASYPELSCTGGPFEVGTQFGIYRDVLCVGKESVFKVLEDVLREVIDLFPSKFIHIGGDEAPRTRWKKCPNCQARMVKEKIEDINGLQTYFTNRISEFLIAEGKEVVSWNETIDKFLNKEINCQYWSGSYEEVLNELKNGRKVVISEINFNYFNYPYRLNSLKHTYQFDPIPEGLPEEFHENILGIEACVWTELIKTKDKLEWQLFPRLIATAEIGWTQKNMRNYQDFEHRLEILMKEFEKSGINFSIKEEYDGNHTNRAERYLRGT
jgi:hexosaminidase